MASFTIAFPADPLWLHVARTTAVVGTEAAASAGVDFIDDVTLALGEAMLDVCITPGVTSLEVSMDSQADRVEVHIVGRGEDLSYEGDTGTIVHAVLEGLAVQQSMDRGEREYSIGFIIRAA